MNLHDWIDELMDVLDIEVEMDEGLVLDVARQAAHRVQRPAAPISTFLLGYAAGLAEGGTEEIEALAAPGPRARGELGGRRGARRPTSRWTRPSSSRPTEPAAPETAGHTAVPSEPSPSTV